MADNTPTSKPSENMPEASTSAAVSPSTASSTVSVDEAARLTLMSEMMDVLADLEAEELPTDEAQNHATAEMIETLQQSLDSGKTLTHPELQRMESKVASLRTEFENLRQESPEGAEEPMNRAREDELLGDAEASEPASRSGDGGSSDTSEDEATQDDDADEDEDTDDDDVEITFPTSTELSPEYYRAVEQERKLAGRLLREHAVMGAGGLQTSSPQPRFPSGEVWDAVENFWPLMRLNGEHALVARSPSRRPISFATSSCVCWAITMPAQSTAVATSRRGQPTS